MAAPSSSGANMRLGKGAAEEPEPEPDPLLSATAPYDPREYQPPHPDDRGGGGGGKPSTKKGGAGMKGAKDKIDRESKGAAKGKSSEDEEDDGTHRCGNCDAPDAKSKCKGCGVEYYCNRECQTVGLRRR